MNGLFISRKIKYWNSAYLASDKLNLSLISCHEFLGSCHLSFSSSPGVEPSGGDIVPEGRGGGDLDLEGRGGGDLVVEGRGEGDLDLEGRGGGDLDLGSKGGGDLDLVDEGGGNLYLDE